ncbi:HAD-superfamily subfamily IIA hydrolase [Phakopsora pachyrhizi]|uniref:HAD-superfamily subfamily IIA hydrolase n=1 Tax=Phakopsora pachyrhizi TaxID=170000 RepID=A0AAV0AI62_PHAPC|nr:HAD-superfamily subfamily IIA hydrolase [Phakopsora pachyrhizi]
MRPLLRCSPDLVWRFKVSFFHSGRINQSQRLPNRNLPAFCFDIDGVLKRGKSVLSEAKEALSILNGKNPQSQRFPIILCTNGGGVPEEERCQRLSDELGIPITKKQLVQSHTIFTQFLDEYRTKPILVVGGASQRCRKIAEEYGFQHVYIPQDILKWNPTVWPFHKLTEKENQMSKSEDFSKISFSAIFVMHDPLDWGLSVQLAIDVLTSKGGVITNPADKISLKNPHEQPKIYFSNPDILWGNEFLRPRFGQGAFQTALRANYEQVTGQPLKSWTGGKPSRVTYEFAEGLLLQVLKESFGNKELGNVYMIGDNPASDIQGANNFGWRSVLVQTGVFKGETIEDSQYPPSTVQPNVLDAVKWALMEEGFSSVV